MYKRSYRLHAKIRLVLALIMISPIFFFLTFITSLISLGILGGGGYLIWSWYKDILEEAWVLPLGITAVLFTFLGRWIILLFIGKNSTEKVEIEESSAKVDVSDLQVKSFGASNKPTIIAMHGWAADSEAWGLTIKELRNKFHTIAWDLPGLGKSKEKENEDYSLIGMAADLRRIIDKVGKKDVVLMGHSIGGMIILTFLKQHPEYSRNIRGIILTNTTYTNPIKTAVLNKPLLLLQKPIIEPFFYLMMILSPLVRLFNFLSYLNGLGHILNYVASFSRDATKNQIDFTTKYLYKSKPAVVAKGMLGMFKYDATDILNKIQIPTLIFAGKEDIVTLESASTLMNKKIKTSKLISLTPANHMGYMEQYKSFNSSILQFLQKI